MEDPDLTKLIPLSEEEMRERIAQAVQFEIYKLRWPKWRKGMDMQQVLYHSGVDAFVQGVATRLAGYRLFRSPLPPSHSSGAHFRAKSD